jgi:glutamate synthase domain-containing protein 3/thioredoxin reductase/Pyruvate/2-oxoacid:ferredoxin oxidoreductase delta subunit
MTLTIDARGIYYRQLNELVRREAAAGRRHIVLQNVRGQRYIGAGLAFPDLLLEIEGVPGEDLAFCMGGPTVIVHGHGQNAIANTMDSGVVVVHGLGGDALAYGMRGGKLFVRDNVGYRVGIHMKEYKKFKPAIVIGATTGDFLGEYMAGGTLVVLNRHNETENVAGQADRTLATGIHGGELFIFNYAVPPHLPGIGAKVGRATRADLRRIRPLVEEFCRRFAMEAAPLLERDVVKIVPAGSRPFSKFYYPTYPVDTGLKPEQCELASPCEAACPVGIPTGRFLRHIRLGEFKEALLLIDGYTPFRYSNCGFICPHLCMESCSRGKIDFPVRTVELARGFRGDPAVAKTGDFRGRIAVIGAGPAGLTAAYFLARLGYAVDVYEAGGRAGGKMHQVISRQRLPLEDLEQDLERITALGVNFHYGTRVDGKKFAAILSGADHVIVATGAHRPQIPPVNGKELIRGGLDFLKAYNLGEKPVIGSRVVVIGGGDAAMDGIEALSELQVSPEQITVIDIQTPSASLKERKRWEQAGVKFLYPLFLQEVTAEGVVVEDSAKRLEFIPGDALAFINEAPEMDFLPEEVRDQLDRKGFFTGGETGRTIHPRISITGDAAGLGLVAHSIRKARECALSVHALLQELPYQQETREAIKLADLRLSASLPLDSLDDLTIQEEYRRCLHCGVCVLCDDCVEACPRQARSREGDRFSIDLKLCGGCGSCAAACRGGVIRMVPR